MMLAKDGNYLTDVDSSRGIRDAVCKIEMM